MHTSQLGLITLPLRPPTGLLVDRHEIVVDQRLKVPLHGPPILRAVDAITLRFVQRPRRGSRQLPEHLVYPR